MTEFLMVGVRHRMQGLRSQALLDEVCEQRFLNEIAPRLTNRSIIIAEGYRAPSFLAPGTPEYRMHGSDFERILPVANRPHLGFVDPRYSPNGSKQRQTLQAMEAWLRFTSSVGRIRQYPSTPEECEAMIRAGTFEYTLARAPGSELLNRAREIYAINKRFNREHMNAMRMCMNRFDLCIVLCGDNHALDLSMKTGHPYLSFGQRKDLEFVHGTYSGYIWVHVLPHVIAEKSPHALCVA